MNKKFPDVSYRPLNINDFEEATSLWQTTENIGLSRADSYENMGGFLVRNPGLSFVALVNHQIIGTVLCGHDGRRGFIYHLAVVPQLRGFGIGRELVKLCLEGLSNAQIERCHIHVYADNKAGLAFWKNNGWFSRPELELLSFDIPAEM